ncbi:MAG: hypothetical protein WBC91_18010 [Phototrophicaceae bacterium]
MIYKVSYIVNDGSLPGSIKNEQQRPSIGDIVRIGSERFTVIDVYEIMPPRGNFLYLHATVEQVVEARA